MTILILAAGVSKRMWPLATDKLLLPFLGKPFFYHTLKALKEAKENLDVVIVVNPNNKEGLGKIAQELGITPQFAVQEEANGMGGAILAAAPLLKDSVLIMNGDDLLEPDFYKATFSYLESSVSDIHLTAKVVKDYFPGGYLKVKDNTVLEIIERPGAGNEPSDMVKLVFDYFKDSTKLIEAIKQTTTEKDDLYERAMDKMITDGALATVSRYEGSWGALKYPWHVLHVMDLLLSRMQPSISPSAKIAESATVEGSVVIGENVKVFENAVVKGPCYLGPNSIVGTNSLVRNSILEEGVVTGFSTEIARSYVGVGSWFHTNYVGDSVIEGDFGMGSGAVIANLRLDGQTVRTLDNTLDTGLTKLGVIAGKGVRIGVNAMTMPGVNLGANSLVGPGVIATKNLSESTRLLLKQETTESENNKTNTSYGQFKDKIEK